jgi:hypothetical protein
LSSTTVVAKFTLTPENSSVTFKRDATNELSISYTQSNATLGACTLKEVGGSDIDTTTAGGGLIAFDFADQPTDYAVSGATVYEVQCAVAGITSPASVSTQFVGSVDPIKWFDGNIDVTGAGTALFPTSTTAQVVSAS